MGRWSKVVHYVENRVPFRTQAIKIADRKKRGFWQMTYSEHKGVLIFPFNPLIEIITPHSNKGSNP